MNYAENRLTFDSRTVKPGDTFFALRGVGFDGHDFIADAIKRGAARVVCEKLPDVMEEEVANCRSSQPSRSKRVRRGDRFRELSVAKEARSERPDEGNLPETLLFATTPTDEAKPEQKQVEFIVVDDSHRALGEMAAEYYGEPSKKLKLIGVTGTNGKTTTATLLYDLARALGYEAGLISTVDYRVGDIVVPSTHTTPDPIRLNAMMAEMVDRGCEFCFMEVSSHSIVQQRIGGLHFTGGVFTNITHDHLDYHLTMANYIAAKKAFFDGLPREAFALTNVDDRNGRVMVQNTRARVKTLSLRSMADYRCKIVEQHPDGMLLQLDGTELWAGFTGRFNAYNLLTVYATARELGFEKEEVLMTISTLHPVNGRFETIRSNNGVTSIVDYAHTPDALENVLKTINDIRIPGSKLFTVVGCGGERDRTKRPVMAKIAAEASDMTFLTSDNPRSEDPQAIIDEMRTGLDPTHKTISIVDRREAIRAAVGMAAPGDIILVAGKGHETYQIIGTERHHFDDKEEIKKAFECYTV